MLICLQVMFLSAVPVAAALPFLITISPFSKMAFLANSPGVCVCFSTSESGSVLGGIIIIKETSAAQERGMKYVSDCSRL